MKSESVEATRWAFGFFKSHISGLTLIELMVALAIFSVLGVLSYRAVSAATEGHQRLTAEFQRWREITHFLHMAETDMMQIAQASVTMGTELSFIKFDGAGNTVRRRGYRLVGDHIVLLRWPGIDASSPPLQDILLKNVKALRVSFLTETGQRSPSWPSSLAVVSSLPAAIDIELELTDVGTIRRLFSIY